MNIDKPIKWSIWTFITVASVSLFLYTHNKGASWPAFAMISILCPMAVFFYRVEKRKKEYQLKIKVFAAGNIIAGLDIILPDGRQIVEGSVKYRCLPVIWQTAAGYEIIACYQLNDNTWLKQQGSVREDKNGDIVFDTQYFVSDASVEMAVREKLSVHDKSEFVKLFGEPAVV